LLAPPSPIVESKGFMDSPWPTKVGSSVCETCGQEPEVGVFCLTEMPASAGMGKKCLAEGAEPFHWLRRHVAACLAAGVRDSVAYEAWLDKLKTYVEGNYVTLREALARHPITQEEIARQKSWQTAHW